MSFYKRVKFNSFDISFETFPNSRKQTSPVWNTGFHAWESDYGKNYAFVLHRARFLIDLKKKGNGEVNA